MSEAVFRKAVHDFVSIGGGPVGLTPIVGEALIHPQFLERVRYLRSFPSITSVFLTTNGILLDRHGIDEVLDSGVTSIIISTAGFERGMYRRVFRSDAYDRMRRNCQVLLEKNATRNHPIEVRIALRSDRPLHQVMSDPDFQPILAYHPPLTFHWAFGSARRRIVPNSLPKPMLVEIKSGARECCEYLLRGPIVLSDGTVLACCCSPASMDAGDLALGHIMDSTLLDIWTGGRMRDLRLSFPRNCQVDTCSGCGQYEGLDLFRTPAGRRMARLNLARYQSTGHP
jgi:hypothetical protein